LITTPIEHSAIREPAEAMRKAGVAVHHLCIDENGSVDLTHFDALLAEHRDANVLVSLHWANNETGVIEPIEAIAERIAAARRTRRRLLLHTDATQAAGKLPIDLARLHGVDLLTLSAHKF